MALSPSQLLQLQTEIQTDPSGYGYPAILAADPTDYQAVRDALNLIRPGLTVQDDSVRAEALRATIVHGEFLALTPGDQRFLMLALSGVGSLMVGSGSTLRTSLAQMFNSGTTTRSNWLALLDRDGSRLEQLFGPNLSVTWQEVRDALGA